MPKMKINIGTETVPNWIVLDAKNADTVTTIPTLSGDVSNSGNTVTLKTTGVSAGTYTKVTVNTKGLVTGSSSLVAGDIPNLTLSKISDAGTAASKNTGVASGNVPVLDSNGKLDSSILPAIAITDTFVVASQTAMLALTAEVGDVAVRTDLNKSFILKTAGASTLANWQELLTPADAVTSVAGKTGTVTLTSSDVGLGNVTNESKSTMFTSPNFTGTPTLASTPATADNSTKIATTAFVKAQNYLTSNQSVTVSGDATGSGSTSISLTLANSGVSAGSYSKVTVDAKGRVTSGSNVTPSEIGAVAGYIGSVEPSNPATNMIWIDTN